MDYSDAADMPLRSSQWLHRLGNGLGTWQKLIVKVPTLSASDIDALDDLDFVLCLHSAKVYKGSRGDILLILYLSPESPDLDDEVSRYAT